jgi:hypothetical protein
MSLCDLAGNQIKPIELSEEKQLELKQWGEFTFPACFIVLEEYSVEKLNDFLNWFKVNKPGPEVLRIMGDPAFTAWFAVHGTHTGRVFLKVLKFTTWIEVQYEKVFYWRRKILNKW